MTDELRGRPINAEFGFDEDELIDLNDDPAPLHEQVTLFALSDAELEEEVVVDPFAHRKSKSAHHSSGWVRGPGMVELLSEAAHLLVTVTELKGQLNQQLPWVRVTALKKKRCLLVRPTVEADLNKKKVTWRQGKAHFVASDVLLEAGFPVETGYKKRYEVHLHQSSKKGPMIVIDMREPLDVRILPKSKGKSKSKGA